MNYRYRAMFFAILFFIDSNIITLRSTVGCTWIDNANYFRLILQFLSTLSPRSLETAASRYVRGKVGRKKEKKYKSLQTVLFRCFWQGCVTKSETTLLLNSVSCLSSPLCGNSVAAAKHFPTERHSIFLPSLPFFFELPQHSFPSRNVERLVIRCI